MLEAKAEAGPVNVRADADIESDRLGTIQAGEQYPVLGRRFRWLQIQFLSAPDGRAWVFEELVTITGDAGSIPNLILAAPPAIARVQVDATRTQAAFTLTPGAVLTMTASARILDLPGREVDLSAAVRGETSSGNNLLPTYTFPPKLVLSTATPLDQIETETPESRQQVPGIPERIPPAVPIALLATGGLLGLVLYSLRSR
ncbi:MAG: SH3 domain-containing protein [Anaerolineaceae bacterium]|nr:SH3 domain-containing protein [Anaerolineaceae bacterium]